METLRTWALATLPPEAGLLIGRGSREAHTTSGAGNLMGLSQRKQSREIRLSRDSLNVLRPRSRGA